VLFAKGDVESRVLEEKKFCKFRETVMAIGKVKGKLTI